MVLSGNYSMLLSVFKGKHRGRYSSFIGNFAKRKLTKYNISLLGGLGSSNILSGCIHTLLVSWAGGLRILPQLQEESFILKPNKP